MKNMLQILLTPQREKRGVSLPTGMVEVVTAVAWEECEAIVMVTIVLLGIWVCGTVPKHEENIINNICITSTFQLQLFYSL